MCNFEYETVSEPEPSRTPLMNLDNPNLTVWLASCIACCLFRLKKHWNPRDAGKEDREGNYLSENPSLQGSQKDNKRMVNGYQSNVKWINQQSNNPSAILLLFVSVSYLFANPLLSVRNFHLWYEYNLKKEGGGHFALEFLYRVYFFYLWAEHAQ